VTEAALPPPLRVLHLLVSTSVGGGPRQVWDLARHLPPEEIEVRVAGPRDGVFFERFRALGVPVAELPRGLGPSQLLAALRLIRAARPEVVHTHGKGPGLLGRLAARWAGVPAVHTFHGIHYAHYPPGGRALYLALERALSGLTHTVVNVSPSQEAEGLSLRLFSPAQSVVIVNGLDLPEVDRALAASSLTRAGLGLPAEALLLGSVARFDPVKRLSTLVRAVHRLAPSHPRLALLLVGGGAEEAGLRRLAAELGLEERVNFTGFVDEALGIYPLLDLYVSASLKEGLPYALLEAMAAGRAVVATDVAGNRDVVVAGETGLLVPPEDPDALARAVAGLLADPARRRLMGEAGRQRVLKEFSVEPMARATADVYRRAAASRGL
jgi:glycosyltransferase involved in cell wall biosynthesis